MSERKASLGHPCPAGSSQTLPTFYVKMSLWTRFPLCQRKNMVNSDITLEAAHLFMRQIYGTDVGVQSRHAPPLWWDCELDRSFNRQFCHRRSATQWCRTRMRRQMCPDTRQNLAAESSQPNQAKCPRIAVGPSSGVRDSCSIV